MKGDPKPNGKKGIKGIWYSQEGQKARAPCREHDNLERYLGEEEAKSPSPLHISWHAPTPLPDQRNNENKCEDHHEDDGFNGICTIQKW